MDFSYSEDQIALREAVIKFAEQELCEGLIQRDQDGTFWNEGWDKCAQMRLMALPFPEEYGGSGLDFLTTVTTMEAFACACKDSGLVHALCTQILCGMQILAFGSKEQKSSYLPAICSGSLVMAQAITEPESGSDAMAMRTRAKQEKDSWVINGSKTFITNGPIADAVIVFAVTDPDKRTLQAISAFIVNRDSKGFESSPTMIKMGLRTLLNGELFFTNCTIPETNILGREGQGAILFNDSMEWERCLIPAAHLGTMERILKTTISYAKERQSFGQPIAKYQAISHRIADIKVNLELGRMALYRAAALKDKGKRATMEASVAKLFISESLKAACLDGVQILGGYGFSVEYELERDLRDSIASTIYSGTSEMQRNIISRLLGM
jgi:alkylation response protein AidB-like acyl-CoA dehydrogenase